MAEADTDADANFYRQLAQIASGQGDIALFEKLNRGARELDWARAEEKTFIS